MISEHSSSHESHSQNINNRSNPLSQADMFKLTIWKWRYTYEAFGFDNEEVNSLLLVTWRHATRRTNRDRPPLGGDVPLNTTNVQAAVQEATNIIMQARQQLSLNGKPVSRFNPK